MFQRARTMTRYARGLALQQGSVLIIALVFLLAMTLIGVTAMQGTTQQESMAGNMRNRNLAFQAAEAALRAGERALTPTPPAVLPAFDGTTPGYIAGSARTDAQWINYTWDNTASQQLLAGTLDEVAEQPRYVIENRTAAPADVDPFCAAAATLGNTLSCYRITARGVGGTTDAVVILQATYRL